jgi:orotate phosphoribosyltransferase
MTVAASLDLPLLAVHRGDPAFIRDLLAREGVIEHGHYQLLSGLHSDAFIRFSALARDDEALGCVGDWLTPSLKPWEADAVVAPSTAGVALAWTLALRLGLPLHLAAAGDDGRASRITSGLDEFPGRRVLLVNDVVTTGAGISALARLVEDAGAEVAGAAWFASRSPVNVEGMIGAPTAFVVALELAAVAAEDCESCRHEIPLERATDLN